ncbi:MAG: LapA family protein, partial [Atribacterota bacterium]|nr:LapA family protein [Atribacterota bacterium]
MLAVIFALQNAVPVTVSFIAWRVESSLALILIITFIAGLA